MDNLRNFLETHCPTKNQQGDSWKRLTQKLNQLKGQDQNLFKTTLSNQDTANHDGVDSVVQKCVKIFQLCHKSVPSSATIPVDLVVPCEKAIYDLQKLISSKISSRRILASKLLDDEATLPLQLVWMIHSANLYQISSYVLRKIPEGQETLLSTQILWLLEHSAQSAEFSKIIADTFASLLVASHCGILNRLSIVCSAILKQCVDDIVNHVIRSPEAHIDFSYILSLELRQAVGSSAMEQFVVTHLLQLLNIGGTPYSVQTLLFAVEIQEKMTLECLPSYQKLIVPIVKLCGVEKVLIQVAAALVKPLINWRAIFLVIAAVVAENPDCCESIQRRTDELIQIGLESGRQTELSAGFLVARHCCTCDSKNFSSYSTWFSSHFGPDSVTARNTVQFQTLMQLLTDIVPVESAENLRVHINKVPQAPTSCNAILHDYTVLARTRLADLNESTELASLFSDSKRDSNSGMDSKQGDVIKVLQHFEQTREIMKPVLEASIFRRQYYRNTFLVELLRLPGCSEETIKAEDLKLNCDTRDEFISALKAMGKIPDKLYKAYVDQRSSQKLEERESEIQNEENVELKCGFTDSSKRKKSLQVKKPKRQ